MITLLLLISMAFASYLGYPILMQFLARGKKWLPYLQYDRSEALPEVSIFIPLHNEANVISEKLLSVLQNDYPKDKVKIYCGLDDCTDKCESIIRKLQLTYPDQIFFLATKRIGKPNMLNLLFEHFQPAEGILILTDANVIFRKDTIFELVKYFKDREIGLTDAGFILGKEQVSNLMEGEYLGLEQGLKFNEGLVWGTSQGPFGGCYAMRSSLFVPVEPNFLVDDFFMAMQVMIRGYKAIMNPDAKVLEEVHTNREEEFRRKKRISTGNFQNLSFFRKVLTKPLTPLAFCFFHHKVIRWILPVAAIPVLLLSLLEIIILKQSPVLWLITLTLILTPIPLHYFLQKLNLQSRTIGRLSYFMYINFALLQGFITFIKGVENNVWKPTKRQ
jgi:cellulose synthase/poly-beta-1,6-N-acetylglucosamine synthase-like glycosyltransferase